jgi:lysozyme
VNRKPIFDAARKLGARFRNDADVAVMDRAIDEALSEPRPSTTATGRRMTPVGRDRLKSREKLELAAYPDPGSRDGSPWTIGYGHTGPEVHKGLVWTEAQAQAAFDSDLARFEDGVNLLLGATPTTQNQFDALVSLAFNIGLDIDADTIAEGLGDSSLLKAHKAGDYETAANKFLAWRFNDGREMKGLLDRRKEEAEVYRGGNWR